MNGEKALFPKAFIAENQEKMQQRERRLPITEAELQQECQDNERCLGALKEMLDYAAEYTADVWQMKQLVKDRKNYDEDEWAQLFAKADSDRTRLHNTYIDSIAILLRAMNAAELNTEWARELMPAGKLERSACGAFGIMLTYNKYVNRLDEE